MSHNVEVWSGDKLDQKEKRNVRRRKLKINNRRSTSQTKELMGPHRE